MIVALSLILWTLPALSRMRKGVLSGVAIAVVCLGIALVPATSYNRIFSLVAEVSEGTLNYRTILWRAGWNAFVDVPFIGVGAGAYPEASARLIGKPTNFVAVAHNSFFSVLVETGIIGFSLFALMLGILIRSAFNMPWLQKRFWLTLMAVWTIGVSSLTWEYRKPTWLLWGLLAAHSAAIARPGMLPEWRPVTR